MNNNELRMLRKLFFLEVAEAAKHIGKVEPRTWQRWEDGTRNIPNDVTQTMQMLSLTRSELLIVQPDLANPAYLYFENIEDHAKVLGITSVIKWRMAQSIAAQLVAENHASIWQSEETIQEKQYGA